MNQSSKTTWEKIVMHRHGILCLISLGLILIPITWALINYKEYYGIEFFIRSMTLQFSIILAGTVIIIIFVIIRLIGIPKIDNLEKETAKLLFSTTINFMLASYAAFGIAFSILWGNLYTYAISHNNSTRYISNLKGEGTVLLLFTIFSSVTIFLTFLWPLLDKINKMAKKNDELIDVED